MEHLLSARRPPARFKRFQAGSTCHQPQRLYECILIYQARLTVRQFLIMWRRALNKFLFAAIAVFFAGSAQAADLCNNTSTCNVTLTGSMHLASLGNLPTVAAGAGAGTGPTVTMTAGSHDSSGQLSVLTGTSPTTSASIATITFGGAQATTFVTAPWCTFSPANSNAAGVTSTYVSTVSTSAVVISLTGTLTATTTYLWNYTCVQ